MVNAKTELLKEIIEFKPTQIEDVLQRNFQLILAFTKWMKNLSIVVRCQKKAGSMIQICIKCKNKQSQQLLEFNGLLLNLSLLKYLMTSDDYAAQFASSIINDYISSKKSLEFLDNVQFCQFNLNRQDSCIKEVDDILDLLQGSRKEIQIYKNSPFKLGINISWLTEATHLDSFERLLNNSRVHLFIENSQFKIFQKFNTPSKPQISCFIITGDLYQNGFTELCKLKNIEVLVIETDDVDIFKQSNPWQLLPNLRRLSIQTSKNQMILNFDFIPDFIELSLCFCSQSFDSLKILNPQKNQKIKQLKIISQGWINSKDSLVDLFNLNKIEKFSMIYLYPDNNQIEQFVEGSESLLQNLVSLKLSVDFDKNFTIDKFPRNLPQLKNIKYLKISGCIILNEYTQWFKQLSNCNNLEELNIQIRVFGYLSENQDWVDFIFGRDFFQMLKNKKSLQKINILIFTRSPYKSIRQLGALMQTPDKTIVIQICYPNNDQKFLQIGQCKDKRRKLYCPHPFAKYMK